MQIGAKLGETFNLPTPKFFRFRGVAQSGSNLYLRRVMLSRAVICRRRRLAMLTRDDLVREYRARSGSLAALLFVYLILVATLVFTASAIV